MISSVRKRFVISSATMQENQETVSVNEPEGKGIGDLPHPLITKDGRFKNPWEVSSRPSLAAFQWSRFRCKDRPQVPSNKQVGDKFTYILKSCYPVEAQQICYDYNYNLFSGRSLAIKKICVTHRNVFL